MVTTDTSFFSLFWNAGLVVQLVMLALVLASIFSWTLIFQRSHFIKESQYALEAFEYNFASGVDLGFLYNKLSVQSPNELSALDSIFVVGYKEFLRLSKQAGNIPSDISKGVERAAKVALCKEIDKLEHNLPFLATIQSTSPFVGLFGTVWGIMHAFKELGSVQQASVAMVAPGISEALIATAMGLIAAIPAGIAYNRYASRVDKMVNRYQNFIDEFINIIYRKAADGHPANKHKIRPEYNADF